MPSPQVHTFTLTPHTPMAASVVRRIGGQVSRTPGGLLVNYVLEGSLEHLRIPEPQSRRFADELWRHTCFELFIARKGAPQYLEFNFSPSGEWAVYAFAGYRERMPLETGVELTAIDPHVTVCRSSVRLELDAVVHLARLLPHHAGAIRLGLSAVVEVHDGRDPLSYWALNHPSAKPDFHHPDAFVLEL